MTDGFGVDLTEIGALTSGVRSVADSLGQAGQALGRASGGDFGQDSLNAAVNGLVTHAQSLITGLRTHTGGMADDLGTTGQFYAESDQSGQSGITAVGQQIPDGQHGSGDPGFYDPAGFTPNLA
jgi:hypothetical protein